MPLFSILATVILSASQSADLSVTEALAELHLEVFEAKFREAGVVETADFAVLADADLAALGLNVVQRRKFQSALAAPSSESTLLGAGQTTFGSAGKAVQLVKGENELYNHTCTDSKTKANTVCVL